MPDLEPLTLPDFANLDAVSTMQAAMEGARQLSADLRRLEHADATVADFLQPLDDALRHFEQASAPYAVLSSAVGGGEYEETNPQVQAAYTNVMAELTTNAKLYERLRELERADLDPESAYLVETLLLRFRLGGIDCDEQVQEQIKQLSLRIGEIAVEYQRRVAAMLARDLQVGDKTYPVNNFTMQRALATEADPNQRRAILQASLERGTGVDPDTDTRDLVREITRLRDQRAKLLGYENHVQMAIAEETVPDVDTIWQLLTQVGQAATARAGEEKAPLVAMAQADGLEDFTAADWLYYQSRAQAESAAQQVDISPSALAPYLELWQVVEDGVFFAAHELYGVSLTRREDLRGWDETCRVYEVSGEDGRDLGLFIADYFTRPGKNGGAWMTSLQQGCGANGHRSIIINCANYAPVPNGQKKFLDWDEVITCFHEFGHALHGLLSRTHYASTAGTAVPRDFVELPSQLNEMWAYHPRVIANFARHADTGEVMPAQMVQALSASSTFGQGYDTSEYCASALLDQYWHTQPVAEQEDVLAFEQRALQAAGLDDPQIPPRYRSTYFPHAFTIGYDGCYYSYMWAETLVGECEQWFRQEAAKDGDGGLNRAAGGRYVRQVLSRGSSRPPMDSFRELVGRDAGAQAVLRRRGLQ
ncbi:MAG: M3 family metallopeptidase [Actinomycetaceae bacterium]|nr:M3 family metallopeptidase [Actinomycetaceae bacterium]